MEQVGVADWSLVSQYFPDHSDLQCQHRWYKVLNPDLIKGAWTKEVSAHKQLRPVHSCWVYYIL